MLPLAPLCPPNLVFDVSRIFSALASFVIGRPRQVVIAWCCCSAVGTFFAQGLPSHLASETLFPHDSESGRLAGTIVRHVPKFRGIPEAVVITTTSPHPNRPWSRAEALKQHQRDERAVERMASKVPSIKGYVSAPPAYVRHDHRLAKVVSAKSFRLHLTEEEAQRQLDSIETTFNRAATPHRSFSILGRSALSRRYTELTHRDLLAAEKLTLPVVFFLLLVAFMSVATAVLPILMAAVVVAVTLGALAILAHSVHLTVFANTAVTVLALGLGIDYSLFIVTRLREETSKGAPLEEALTVAISRTGRAIALSGSGIALSLLSLLVVGLPDFSSMALGGATVSVVAVLVSLTLTPAILQLLGPRLESLSLPRKVSSYQEKMWRMISRVVVGRSVLIVVLTAGVLMVMALPAISLTRAVRPVGNLPSNDKVSRQIIGLSKLFGKGMLGPIEVATNNVPRVSQALSNQSTVGNSIAYAGKGAWALVFAMLTVPVDSPRAEDTIRQLRRSLQASRTKAVVGGLTAASIDLSDRVRNQTFRVVLLACLLVMAALAVGLRSVVVPVKAVLGTLLSVGATLGLLALLFPTGSSGSDIDPVIPLILFTIIFGLSIDYEVFLLSRVREEALRGADPQAAVSKALIQSARPITLAGLCLASVFAGLATSSLPMLQQLGCGVAIGVTLDVTIVRCMLMPAAAVLLGKWNWWLPAPFGKEAPARG
jgi:putative drug exporter of the RND superfamily